MAYAFFRFVRHLERFRISVTDTFHIQAPYVTSMEKELLNQIDTKFQMIELFVFCFVFWMYVDIFMIVSTLVCIRGCIVFNVIEISRISEREKRFEIIIF